MFWLLGLQIRGVTFIILLLSHKLGGLLGLFGVIIKHIFHLGLGTFCQTPSPLTKCSQFWIWEWARPPPIWAMFPNFTHFFLSSSLTYHPDLNSLIFVGSAFRVVIWAAFLASIDTVSPSNFHKNLPKLVGTACSHKFVLVKTVYFLKFKTLKRRVIHSEFLMGGPMGGQ